MLSTIFENLVILLIIVNTFLYLRSYKYNSSNTSYKLFCLYLICSLIVNVCVFILAEYQINNLYFSHYYFISQFIILSLFYRPLFTKNQRHIILILLVFVLGILAVQYSIAPELYFRFNTTEVFITCFPIVVYSIMHLYNSLNKPSPFMYINSGILLYVTTSTLIFILGDYLSSTSGVSVDNIWFINKVLYVIYLVLILAEWWNNFRLVKSK